MCDPISALVLIGTIGSSFATAMMSSSIAKEEARVQQEQLRVEIENEKIKGMGDTNDRLEQFRKDEASNRAALSAMGLDTNVSYQEGILPFNRQVVRRDVRNIGFNLGQVVGRKKYEIKVAGWRAKAQSKSNYITAFGESVSAVGSSLVHRSSPNAQYPES